MCPCVRAISLRDARAQIDQPIYLRAAGTSGARVLASSDDAPVVSLSFANGRLLQAERELARVGLEGSIVASGREHRIVHTKPHGWHYGVEDRAAETVVCRFHPLLIRRGGRLQSGSVAMHLRGLPLRPKTWRLTTEAGRRVAITSELARSDLFKFDLDLHSGDSIADVPNPAVTPAFACWLIVSWQNAPGGPIMDVASPGVGL